MALKLSKGAKDILRTLSHEDCFIAVFSGGQYGACPLVNGGCREEFDEQYLIELVEVDLATRQPNGSLWNYALTYDGKREAARLRWGF